MKRFFVLISLATLATAPALPALAASPATSGSVVIRHQLRGCHAWSLNGGAYKVGLSVSLARGGSLTISNNDPMVHKLVQQAGPSVRMQTIAHEHMKMVGHHKVTGEGVMNHMGAAIKVTFPAAGVYRFTTEDLGDYFELDTVGKDNHLVLTVRVS